MPNTTEHPYASFIHGIEKPVRYLGGEHGAVVVGHINLGQGSLPPLAQE